MVDRPTLTHPEIAETYGVSLHTVTKTWAQNPAWPAPVGKRGRRNAYAPDDVAAFHRKHVQRPGPHLEPQRLYTARELEAAGVGITATTIRADRSRGRWPEPDDTSDGVNRWRGSTAAQALEGRRSYRRTAG
ncbi:hypothetical protein AB0G64_09360 [Streptomyces longwoodensis]|uniref:hypothetical protein n=1 Tax=Streptomyces longwoodensis TaxID=68231 RepID=UPI0033F949BF